MAASSVKEFFECVLFVIFLQAAGISTLECYECYLDHNQECNQDHLPDKFLVIEPSSNEILQNQAKKIEEILTAKEMELKNGTYCLKWLQAETGAMFRYFMSEAPVATNLDQSGCIWSQQGRICYCDRDKCNNGRILQFNESSALECYGCESDVRAQHGDQKCLDDDPPKRFITNQTAFALQTDAGYWNMDFFNKIRLTPGPFCVKISFTGNDEEIIFRNIFPQAPESSYLDESGCMEINNARACFCIHDRCNAGSVVQPFRCYGCVVGADKELSEYNQEECTEVNPPDQFLVNKTGMIPSFDRFAQNLSSNYTFNRLETIRGPFCVKILHQEERFVFRYMMPVGVGEKYLDAFGCIVIGDGHQMCFCNKDKCNDGC